MVNHVPIAAAAAAVYLTGIFYHAHELCFVRCLFVSRRACDAVDVNKEWPCYFWALPALGASLLCVSSSAVRRVVGVIVLAAWLSSLILAPIDAPHLCFVSLALVHLLLADGRNSHMLAIMRASLSVSYAFSGVAKVATPAWRTGTAIGILASRPDDLRVWARASGTVGVLRAASLPLSWSALLVECGLPLAELVALTVDGVPIRLLYLASGLMHLGILALLPLTEVPPRPAMISSRPTVHAPLFTPHSSRPTLHAPSLPASRPVFRYRSACCSSIWRSSRPGQTRSAEIGRDRSLRPGSTVSRGTSLGASQPS